MNDALRMQISAFVDGELPDNETELLMRRLSQDRTLRALVGEYLRIGRLIRGDREVAGLDGLRARIQAALGEQPAEPAAAPAAAGARFLRPVAGLAIASAVAAVALFALRQVDVPGAGGATVAGHEAPAADLVANTGYTEPQPSEVMDSRPSELLMQYYLSHGATSRDLGANGILTRLVTLELREGELVDTAADGARAVPAIDAAADDAKDVRRGAKRSREDNGQ